MAPPPPVPRHDSRGRFLLAVALAFVAAPRPVNSQAAAQLSATGLFIGTMVDPTADRSRRTEIRLVQPVVMARLALGPLFGLASLDLEGITIPEGELTAAAWGEGFVDRRHPHTYAHELVVGGAGRWRCLGGRDRCGAGLVVGKGFVPFGSDDPMTRPVARFPVNHHWAQILERAMVAGQIAVGGALLEGAFFNGDEPERPGQWPRLARFADSWSARATIAPSRSLAGSVSVAEVASPEHRPGAGSTQHKVHLGVRYQSEDGARYGLVEWARTSELDGFFVFRSLLLEGAWHPRHGRLYYRFERTDRPEEERVSPFRAVRPHLENSIFGISRWTLHTVGAGLWFDRVLGDGEVDPFVELTLGRVRDAGVGLFRVADQYGSDQVHSLSVGVRVSWRMAGHRMGRYGLASGTGTGAHQRRPH